MPHAANPTLRFPPPYAARLALTLTNTEHREELYHAMVYNLDAPEMIPSGSHQRGHFSAFCGFYLRPDTDF